MSDILSSFLLSLLFTLLHIACGAVEWQQASPYLDASPIHQIVSNGEGTLVMIQEDGVMYNSAAGSNEWSLSQVNFPFPNIRIQYVSAFYFKGQFLVFLSRSGYLDTAGLLTSRDGKAFTTISFNATLQGPVFLLPNNGTPTFVSIFDATVSTSSTGLNWNSFTFPGNNSEVMLIWKTASVLFVLMNSNQDELFVTTSGYNYSVLPISSTFGVYYNKLSIVDGAPGEILAIVTSANTYIYVSHDNGLSWFALRSDLLSNGYVDIIYFTGLYVSSEIYYGDRYFAQLQTSQDLKTWENWTIFNLAEDPNAFTVQVEDDLLYALLPTGYSYTFDLKMWSTFNVEFGELVNSIYVLKDDTYVLEGHTNYSYFGQYELKFFSTLDGTNVTVLPLPPFQNYAYQWETNDSFFFLAVNASLTIWNTTDFIDWKLDSAYPMPCQFMRVFNYIVYDANSWLGACDIQNNTSKGNTFELYNAVDPNAWHKVFSADQILYYDLAYGNGVFVLYLAAYAQNAQIYTSVDGMKWAGQSTSVGSTVTSIYFLNDLFFLSQQSTAKLLVSKDGTSWSIIQPFVTTAPTVYNPVSFAYSWDAQCYLAYGYSGLVSTSTDGMNWNSEGYNLPTPFEVTAVAYNGKMWVAANEQAGLFVGH